MTKKNLLIRQVHIIDYGASNIRSVINAVTHLGYEPTVIDNGSDLVSTDHATPIILPGVGRFGPAMKALDERGLKTILVDRIKYLNTPILGICLGFHMLMLSSSESQGIPGLGLLPIEVINLSQCGWDGPIPRVGFDSVTLLNDPRVSPVIGSHLGPIADVYFCHSFGIRAEYSSVTWTTGSEGTIGAVVESGNIFGTQFHPEISQHTGLVMLNQFLKHATKIQ